MNGAQPRFSRIAKSALVRFVIAVSFLAFAVALAWPQPPDAPGPTWATLLQPLAVGREVALGHVLGPPRRGQEHDIVFTLRTPDAASVIEVHVLDRGRWPGVRETASFGVAYETPRSAAPTEACEAVTEALAQALRANDPGGLGPVDAIALPSEAGPEAPRTSRILDRLSGPRGLAAGACLAGFTWILAAAPGGAWGVSAWLFLLGLLLRAPSLGVPFVLDQDVQRVFTGHLPVTDILFGQGLTDRHPPLYFLVLRAAQLFGQSEAVVRAPAAVFGALVGPAIVWGAAASRRRVEAAALAGLIATVSVELIARSREVSSIPLFALLVIGMSVSLSRHADTPSRGWAAIVAASHGLALWTYYLAPFVILGNVAVLAALRRLSRPTLRALMIGVGAGSPALVLGVVTFFRDRGARAAASVHPELAWGERGAAETARLMATLATSALGVAMLVVLAAVVVAAVRKRDIAVLVPAGGLVLAFAGIVALTPVARVQPYYLAAVLPLGALSVGLGADSLVASWRRARTWLMPAVLCAAAASVTARLSAARTLYLPHPDAFMPGFAEIALTLPERRILTVAHYDGTLLAYYLARRSGVEMDWARMDRREGQDAAYRLTGIDRVLESLARSHALAADPDAAALQTLESTLERESVLVVEREGFRLPRLSDRLRSCTLLSESGTGRLHRCSKRR